LLLYPHEPPPSELYHLSLHDALPISVRKKIPSNAATFARVKDLDVGDEDPGTIDVGLVLLDSSGDADGPGERHKLLYRLAIQGRDRKSTRLNSSHVAISYAVFCLKKK